MALVVTLVMTSLVLCEGLFGFFRSRELILMSLDLLYLPLASRISLREFQHRTDAGKLHVILIYCRRRKFGELPKGSTIALDSRLLYFGKFLYKDWSSTMLLMIRVNGLNN
jgi:hypothetical protein